MERSGAVVEGVLAEGEEDDDEEREDAVGEKGGIEEPAEADRLDWDEGDGDEERDRERWRGECLLR